MSGATYPRPGLSFPISARQRPWGDTVMRAGRALPPLVEIRYRATSSRPCASLPRAPILRHDIAPPFCLDGNIGIGVTLANTTTQRAFHFRSPYAAPDMCHECHAKVHHRISLRPIRIGDGLLSIPNGSLAASTSSLKYVNALPFLCFFQSIDLWPHSREGLILAFPCISVVSSFTSGALGAHRKRAHLDRQMGAARSYRLYVRPASCPFARV